MGAPLVVARVVEVLKGRAEEVVAAVNGVGTPVVVSVLLVLLIVGREGLVTDEDAGVVLLAVVADDDVSGPKLLVSVVLMEGLEDESVMVVAGVEAVMVVELRVVCTVTVDVNGVADVVVTIGVGPLSEVDVATDDMLVDGVIEEALG